MKNIIQGINRKIILTGLCVVVILVMCNTSSAAWANTSYTNAKNITLIGADTQLTNYPYLVSIAEESAMQFDYDDLIFYDQPVYGGGNLIDFEIETYNATNATVWLNITTLPTAGKTVSVYYGNAIVGSTENSDATWNSDYVGVWHLADDIDSYTGSSCSPTLLDKYSCWGVAGVMQDSNNLQEYIVTWQRLHTSSPMRAYFNYSVYNTSTETFGALDDIFDNSNNVHQGHATCAYFGEKYHVAYAQTSGTEDFVADVNATTWAELQAHVLTSTEPVVTPDLGWRTEPSYLKINGSSTWLLCPNRYDGGFAYVGYTPWDSANGWGTWTKIAAANDSDCIHIAKGAVKDNVIYLYYVTRSPYAFYMIKSSNYGVTWSEPVNLGVASLDMHSTPVVHLRDNKFVLIYGTEETSPNQMLMYRSTDGETFTDAQVVTSAAGFVHEWAWLSDTHILLVSPDANSFGPYEGDLDTCIVNVSNYLTFQSSGLSIADATSNNNDGFPIGGDSVSGIIGDAIDFSNDHIAINTNDFYNIGTVSWWQNSTVANVAGMAFQGGYNVTGSGDYCQLGKDTSEKQYSHWRTAATCTLRSDADVGQTNEAQQIVWTSNGTTTKCFVNGTKVSLTATGGANTGEWFSDVPNINKYGIGSTRRAAQQYTPFTGIIDQVELSKSVRSNDWINLSYQMVVNDSYVAFGTEKTYVEPIVGVIISLYSKYPDTLFTNYTGFLSASYIVESNYPLNFSSLAYLFGVNYTLTDDYHSYLKVPANDIADDGIYRAHNRNTTPYMHWESNDTITEGNVWKWSGGDNSDFWIQNESINATHTWVNVTGRAGNVFPSMFYLGRQAMYESEKTGIEINKGQGIIFKIWDLEQYRGRSYNYYLSLYFDTQIKSTPNDDIEIWYCNDSFDPTTDDPCLVCDYKDTWTSVRWMDHESWQSHNNVSFAKPLTIHAGTATCPSSPTEVNYIYLKSDTVSSKSYILNATNDDPNIYNLTFAETETMWLRNEISGTNTPHAYTPSFYNTFTRDYLEFTHHLYIANDQDVWGHSDYNTQEIGLSDIPPTYCRFNYFWWNGTTDYYMNGSYTENFNINLTYGFDPDNGASLIHVLSLYDNDYNFIAFVNDSLIGNQTDVDIPFNVSDYLNKYSSGVYRFKIVSTDNEGSTSVTWSNEFCIKRDSWFKTTAPIITGFPAAIGGILTSFLSFLPLFIGILISGFLILVCVGVFGKLKRW